MALCWPWVAVNMEGLVWEKVINIKLVLFSNIRGDLVEIRLLQTDRVPPNEGPQITKEFALNIKDVFVKRYQ